jgi:hypothetical protein
MKRVINLILFLCFCCASAQTEVFHDFSYQINIGDTNEWNFDGEFEWKHLYGEEGWSRTSFNMFAHKEFGVVTLFGGLKNNYTFDNDIVNFWELRPWLGFELENKLTPRLTLLQELKGEFRNFFFSDNNYDFNFRTKYKIALEYPLKYLEEEEDWIVTTEVEWYFLRNEEINERFINSREYSLLLSKEIRNDKTLSFGLRLEEYTNNLINESDKAITLVLRVDI